MEEESLITQTTAVGPFLDRDVMQERGVTENDIATFLNNYTIADNWGEELPEGYDERGDENIFEAAFPTDDIDRVLSCATGSSPG